MSFDAHKNFAFGHVSAAPTPADSGLSLVLVTGDALKFPATPFNATVYPLNTRPNPSNAEIVRVTNISGDVLTIQRTQEGSGSRLIQAGDEFSATITQKTLTDIENSIAGFITPGTAFAGSLVFGTAASKIVPGATSLAFRNSADSANNLLISDAGLVTVRAGLNVAAGGAIVAAGDLSVTAGRLIFGAAASKVVPGATSLSICNNSDTATNVLINNAGSVTITGADGSGSGVAGSGHVIHAGAGGGGNAAGGSLSVALGANTGTAASGQLTITSSSADGQTAMGTIHSLTHTFATLTAPYGDVNSQTRMFVVDIQTDTSANGYAGILNAMIAHVQVNTAAGSMIHKAEAFSGGVIIQSGSGGDIGSGSFGVEGDVTHQGTQTITGTVKGVNASCGVTSSGSFTTAYGLDASVLTTLGQIGRFTNTAQAINAHVDLAAVVTVGAATAIGGVVTSTTTGTVTNVVQGVLGYITNSGDCTYNGNLYGVRGLTEVTGAAAFGAGTVVNGIFADLTYTGTTTGGVSANTALQTELRWQSSGVPATDLIGQSIRWRVENVSLTAGQVANIYGLKVLAPVVTGTVATVITAGYGVRILNQGNAASVSTTALFIDAQSGSSSNNWAIQATGRYTLTNTGGAGLITSTSQNLSVTTTVSGTLTVQSVGLLTLTGVGASVWTPGAGATIVSDTVTGIKIGTGITQKLGFWNATPVVQQVLATGAGATADNIITFLQTIGLCKQS